MIAKLIGPLAALTLIACTPPSKPSSSPPAEAGLGIPDLASMTRLADVVIVGRVATPGTTREIAQPPLTPVGPTRAPSVSGSSTGGGISVPVTTYTIDVERVARGNTVPGPQLTLTQSGNPIRQASPGQDDAPLVAGQRYVLFLRQADASTYAVVGDIQGRLSVDAQDRVHPVGSGSPATRDRDGQALDVFLNDVASIN